MTSGERRQAERLEARLVDEVPMGLASASSRWEGGDFDLGSHWIKAITMHASKGLKLPVVELSIDGPS